MRVLAWIISVLMIIAGLHAVDWSLVTAITFIGVAVLLLSWIATASAQA